MNLSSFCFLPLALVMALSARLKSFLVSEIFSPCRYLQPTIKSCLHLLFNKQTEVFLVAHRKMFSRLLIMLGRQFSETPKTTASYLELWSLAVCFKGITIWHTALWSRDPLDKGSGNGHGRHNWFFSINCPRNAHV